MRPATYEYRGRCLRGVADGAAVRLFPGGTTLPGLIRSGGPFGPVAELPPLGDPVAVNGVRLLPPERLGRRLLQGEDRTEGGRRPERLDASVGDDTRGLPAVGRTGTLTYGADGGRCRGLEGLWELTVLAESFVPPPRVAVFATVGLAAPVAQPGDLLGCRASVCDARPVSATADRFLGAHEGVVEWAAPLPRARSRGGSHGRPYGPRRAHPRPQVRPPAARGRPDAESDQPGSRRPHPAGGRRFDRGRGRRPLHGAAT